VSGYDYESRVTIPRHLIEVVPGEPFSLTLPITYEDDAPVAVADASGWSASAQLRTGPDSDTVLHTFVATVNAGSAGSVTLTATAAQTAAWQAARWLTAVSDLRVTDSTGTPHSIADLVFALLPRNTR
jgi:hypothetical protein